MAKANTLLKWVKNVKMAYNPWYREGRGLNEFFERVTSAKARASNPDCKIEHELVCDKDFKPSLLITYHDGSQQTLAGNALNDVRDIVTNMQTYTYEWEMNESADDEGGKSTRGAGAGKGAAKGGAGGGGAAKPKK